MQTFNFQSLQFFIKNCQKYTTKKQYVVFDQSLVQWRRIFSCAITYKKKI